MSDSQVCGAELLACHAKQRHNNCSLWLRFFAPPNTTTVITPTSPLTPNCVLFAAGAIGWSLHADDVARGRVHRVKPPVPLARGRGLCVSVCVCSRCATSNVLRNTHTQHKQTHTHTHNTNTHKHTNTHIHTHTYAFHCALLASHILVSLCLPCNSFRNGSLGALTATLCKWLKQNLYGHISSSKDEKDCVCVRACVTDR